MDGWTDLGAFCRRRIRMQEARTSGAAMGAGTACSVVGWWRAVAVMSLVLAGAGGGGARPPCGVCGCVGCGVWGGIGRSVGRWGVEGLVWCRGSREREIPTHDSSKPYARTRTRGRNDRGRSGPDGWAAAAACAATMTMMAATAHASMRSGGPAAPALGLLCMLLLRRLLVNTSHGRRRMLVVAVAFGWGLGLAWPLPGCGVPISFTQGAWRQCT